MKLCSRCNLDKDIEEFSLNKNRPDGRHIYCKTCDNARAKAYRASLTEEQQEARREYTREFSREYRRSGRRREKDLRGKYGLGTAEYDQMLAGQGGVCIICGTSEPKGGRGKGFVVDHNHKTGKVRGLLCNNCNSGIGLLQDDPLILRKAVDYLEGQENDYRNWPQAC